MPVDYNAPAASAFNAGLESPNRVRNRGVGSCLEEFEGEITVSSPRATHHELRVGTSPHYAVRKTYSLQAGDGFELFDFSGDHATHAYLLYEVTATGGDNTHIQVTGQSWPVNTFSSLFLAVISGTGAGTYKQISSNTADTLLVPPLGFTPDATTKISIEIDRGPGFFAEVIDFAATYAFEGTFTGAGEIGSYLLQIYPRVTPSFGVVPLFNGTVGVTNVAFTNFTPDPDNDIEWEWNFGDGSPVSTAENPSHIFTNATYNGAGDAQRCGHNIVTLKVRKPGKFECSTQGTVFVQHRLRIKDYDPDMFGLIGTGPGAGIEWDGTFTVMGSSTGDCRWLVGSGLDVKGYPLDLISDVRRGIWSLNRTAFMDPCVSFAGFQLLLIINSNLQWVGGYETNGWDPQGLYLVAHHPFDELCLFGASTTPPTIEIERF